MHLRVFHVPYIKWFKEQGYEVHIAGNQNDTIPEVDRSWHIDIERNPLKVNNLKAYKQLKELIEREKYSMVTCHTAMGGVIARLAARNARKNSGLKMLYTAHGFHFFKNGPVKNWLIYFPIEKYLSHFTDAIITINQEDYEMVRNHKFKNIDTYKIPGIGVNAARFSVRSEEDKKSLRKKYGYNVDDFILLYVAEFIPRKNHMFVIDALPELIKIIPNIKILFAGKGRDLDKTKQHAETLDVSSHLEFLGFRKDIPDLIAISDVGISASKQEGLGLNLAEEMFCGIPVVATEDRGHKELIVQGKNGFIYKQGNINEFVDYVKYLYDHPIERNQMGVFASHYVQKFELKNALSAMAEIYKKYL